MGLKRVLKTIGKVAASPVTIPIKAARKGAKTAAMKILFGVLRHALTTGGGALVAQGTLSGDELNQAIGAIMTLVGIVASVLNKRASDPR